MDELARQYEKAQQTQEDTMNFYKHYIGDYQRDTGHLSLAEHGAYRLMLDAFYATGKPLPMDKKALYRLLRAATAVERKAIDMVCAQFWEISSAGLVNRRAALEIEKAAKQAEINRQIAIEREKENVKDWKKYRCILHASKPEWKSWSERVRSLILSMNLTKCLKCAE